jgi:hypothetical protein
VGPDGEPVPDISVWVLLLQQLLVVMMLLLP